MSEKDAPNYNLKKLKNPTLKRMAKEHIAVHDLCSKTDKISYKVIKKRSSVPEVYHITFKVKSIIAIDEDKNPIFGDEHVAELALPPNYPVEPAKLYMVTDTWHPNIKSEGVHKGHICTNSSELGKLMDLYLLVHRVGEILQYKNYHAENVFPYPDDEKVARWVREYAEPNDIINKSKNIFIDSSSLIGEDDPVEPAPPVKSVVTSVAEPKVEPKKEEPKKEEPKKEEPKKGPRKIGGIVIKATRTKPKQKGGSIKIIRR